MIPLLYLGITSFSLSFAVANFVTSEILRNRFESFIQRQQMKKKQPKTNSKVKFNHEIKVRYIPTRESLSSNTLSSLWYSKHDLNTFKHNYLFDKKYKSI